MSRVQGSGQVFGSPHVFAPLWKINPTHPNLFFFLLIPQKPKTRQTPQSWEPPALYRGIPSHRKNDNSKHAEHTSGRPAYAEYIRDRA